MESLAKLEEVLGTFDKQKALSLTFAIRTQKRLFLGKNYPETLDFTGANFQNGL